LQDIICEHIRNGTDPYTAAEAAGVPREVFERWLRYGQARRPMRRWRDFYQALRMAAAQAICEAKRRELLATYNRELLSTPVDQREGNVRLTLMEQCLRGEPASNCNEPAVNCSAITTEDIQTATAGERATMPAQ
jgi:hypothetical protein